jgi:hypothetical protein
MDREHRRLFSSGRDAKFLVLMDADSGRVLQSLPITSGADANVFESETGVLFVSTFMKIPRTSCRKSKPLKPSLAPKP